MIPFYAAGKLHLPWFEPICAISGCGMIKWSNWDEVVFATLPVVDTVDTGLIILYGVNNFANTLAASQ
jgi:hypothetical protein